jgi:hypothetical protein
MQSAGVVDKPDIYFSANRERPPDAAHHQSIMVRVEPMTRFAPISSHASPTPRRNRSKTSPEEPFMVRMFSYFKLL